MMKTPLHPGELLKETVLVLFGLLVKEAAERLCDALRCTQRARRLRHRPLHAATSPRGVHPVPQRRRARRAGRHADRSRGRQLCHPQAPKVKAWLERHPRWTFHFTPTSGSWLNAVANFFSMLTRKRIRRGSFHSIVDLQAAIKRYLAEHNAEPKPFVWKAFAASILAKLDRLPARSV